MMHTLLTVILVSGQIPQERYDPPQGYVCLRTSLQRPVAISVSNPLKTLSIDGRLDEPQWQSVPWTNEFVDIEGDKKPRPRFRTRAKMLWDDNYLYVAAELEEPHVWATLTQHDSVIFHDNDFEIFLDPDGDNHNYGEFEINALNATWDLRLPKPYKDGGRSDDAFEIAGLESAVHIRGTINNPSDTDQGWSLEVALPWKSLRLLSTYSTCPRTARRTGSILNDYANIDGWVQVGKDQWANRSDPKPPQTLLGDDANRGTHTTVERHGAPRDGEQWRVNFSRVEWMHEVVDGKYRKVPNRPEDNWVWSPQGFINMHRPESWGYVQFSNQVAGQVATTQGATTSVDITADSAGVVKHLLHRLYYAQRQHHQQNKSFANPSDLGVNSKLDSLVGPVRFFVDGETFRFSVTFRRPDHTTETWHIRQDSLLWRDLGL